MIKGASIIAKAGTLKGKTKGGGGEKRQPQAA